MSRPSKTFMVIFYVLVAAIAAVAQFQGAQASEPSIQWDSQQSIKQGQFLRLYARTATCMRQATVAALRQGSRERAPIREFVVGMCGGSLRGWLMTQDGKSQADADAMLDHMAKRALESATQPPSHIFVL